MSAETPLEEVPLVDRGDVIVSGNFTWFLPTHDLTKHTFRVVTRSKYSQTHEFFEQGKTFPLRMKKVTPPVPEMC